MTCPTMLSKTLKRCSHICVSETTQRPYQKYRGLPVISQHRQHWLAIAARNGAETLLGLFEHDYPAENAWMYMYSCTACDEAPPTAGRKWWKKEKADTEIQLCPGGDGTMAR